MAEGETATVSVFLNTDPKRSLSILISTTNLGGATSTDYTGVPLSLTFASGETRKTFTFTAADDTEDDDGERVELGFVGLPTGASPGDTPTATVSIADNDDPIGLSGAFPRTQLLEWFNRATAVETVNALGDRFREAPRGPRAVLRGITLRPMGNKAAASLVSRQDIYGWPERESRLGGFTSARELLSESSFYLPLQPDESSFAGERGNFVAWGKGSTLQVKNRHGNVSIDGSAATFRMGVDGEWDDILAGIAVGKTTGDRPVRLGGLHGSVQRQDGRRSDQRAGLRPGQSTAAPVGLGSTWLRNRRSKGNLRQERIARHRRFHHESRS